MPRSRRAAPRGGAGPGGGGGGGGGGRKEVAAAAGGMKAGLQKNDRKAIEKSAGDLAKAGGRNTVAGSLGTEVRGHAGALAGSKVFSEANLNKGLYVGIAGLIIGAVGFALI